MIITFAFIKEHEPHKQNCSPAFTRELVLYLKHGHDIYFYLKDLEIGNPAMYGILWDHNKSFIRTHIIRRR